MKYTKSHEWVTVEGNIATMGITDHAQDQLSDIIFVDLPEIGAEITQGNEFMVVESVKSANDIYAPVTGTILEVNEQLSDEPELVNELAETTGWFVKIELSDTSEVDAMLTKEAYEATLS